MKENYETCLAITLKWEGGDVNHPDDPGGKTRWGITQGRYDEYRVSKKMSKRSVFQMTKTEMLAIYRTYWDGVKADTLAAGVDLATWDYGVNSGPARARKELLRVVGGTAVQTIQKLCANRMSFLRGLAIWKTFGKGWSNRVAGIEARAVKMALVASPHMPSKSVPVILKAESDNAAKSAVTKTNSAGASGSGAIASSGVGFGADIDQWVSLGILGVPVLAIVAGVYFIHRARHEKSRAAAYAAVAAEG